MSLDYVADPTATQAPSMPPGAGNLPTGRIPTDGQALNVASVWQVFKTLLDFVGFITTYGAFTSVLNIFTGVQYFNAGIFSNDATKAWNKVISGGNGTYSWVLYAGSKRVLLSINATWTDGTAKWSCTNTTQDASALYLDNGSLILFYKSATAGTWNDGAGAGAWTARATFDLTSGDLTSIRNLTATLLQATGQIVAGTTLSSATARSSATPGAGQAVAPGEIWKDTACFAWGKVTVDVGGGVCTLVRGANVASVTKTGVGVYTVTLQTAATNILSIQVTSSDSQPGIIYIDKATPPTTTAFRVMYADPAGVAQDTNGNDGGFYFEVKQG